MKVEELMIGDWVIDTRSNTPLRVNPFLAQLEVREWKPIPLTPEILEKNGFKNTSVVTIGTRKMRWVSDDTRTEITIWMDDTLPMEIVKNVYYEDEVAYTLPFPGTVSQLQHALRLCEINLKINI